MQDQEYALMYAAEDRLWWFRALHLMLNRVLPGRTTQGRVLDIGCGTGGLLERLVQEGYVAFGLDYAAVALRYARQRQLHHLVRASANAIPFGETFDLVTCVDVLEVASVDPDQVAESARACLKPGGYGIFLIAAHQWLLSEHDRAVDSVRRFNLDQLKSLFERHGFHVERASYLYFFVFPLVVARKLLNRQKEQPKREIATSDVSVPPIWINLPLYFICWLESQLLRVANLPMGSSALVLVRKDG